MKLQVFKEKILEIEHQLTSLQSSLRNAHNIEPLNISCDEKEDDAFLMCVKNIEGITSSLSVIGSWKLVEKFKILVNTSHDVQLYC